MRVRAYVACLLAPLITGCLEPLSAPPCSPVSLSEASVSGDTITTTTGLRYIELAAGEGVAADWCRNVAIHYEGFLLDGTKFDSSRDAGAALAFAPGLGSLIDGIEQGVVGVRLGGSRRLIIPPGLAFGPEPRRDSSGEVLIPGNSTVVYDIEVVEVGR
jgi:FKBP-type peptidyl-prolyl cis-trans isomerase